MWLVAIVLDNAALDYRWATIFTRGQFRAFICVSRARFKSNMSIQSLKIRLRGPYVAPSCFRCFSIKNV
jgi:hypothetical protein